MATNVKEVSICTIRAYGDKCMGCKSNEASIMISYQTVPNGSITDMFLTSEQATQLLANLSRCVLENQNNLKKEY